jgi:glutamate racemase
VANAITAIHPELEVVYKSDAEHVPYGSRSRAEILSLITPIIEAFLNEGCAVIVIACNTVSTLLITQLRRQFSVPFVAIEPMVKPAASLTASGIIAVCATPATLASTRYSDLKQQYARDIEVLEPDCRDWSYMIEHDQIDDDKIAHRIETVLAAGADVIVLGCTHYHWIEDRITELAEGQAVVLQPEQAIIRQLNRVIAKL